MGMVMYGDEFETKENKFRPRIKLNHNIYIDVMWLTEKDLQREIKNKGHQFCWRKIMKIWTGQWENEKNASSHQGENEQQWKYRWTGTHTTIPP